MFLKIIIGRVSPGSSGLLRGDLRRYQLSPISFLAVNILIVRFQLTLLLTACSTYYLQDFSIALSLPETNNMGNTSRRKALKAIGLAGLGITTISTGAAASPPPSSQDHVAKGFWDSVRDQFLLDRKTVFFNPGTVGAMPRVVVERMTSHLNMLASDVAQWAYLDDNAEQYISGYNNLLPIRTAVGTLLNCSPSEVAMTDNVTNGMSYLASGLDLSEGDEIITTNQEHSGGISSWKMRAKRHNLVYREVPIPKPIKDPSQVYDLITSSFTPKTRVLMVSHMITGSGALLPVKEICAAARKRGIITILDGSQTIGQVKVDIRDIGCDAYLGCFHKWIGAPCGTGFMYIQKDLMPRVWTTVASGRWENHEDEGFRFTQRGTGSFSILKGLEAALEYHQQLGPENVYARIKQLGLRLREGLRKNKKIRIFSPEDESMCAGITVYNLEGWKGKYLQQEFWDRERMRPRSQGNEFGLRHCTHIFNSEAEIDRAIALVDRLSTESPKG